MSPKTLLAALLSVGSATNAFQGHADLIKNFGGQLRCPHANQWLTKGPEQAAVDLGLKQANHQNHQRQENNVRRSLQQVVASCSYSDPFSGTQACLELRGSAWTNDSLQERCAAQNGTLELSTPCPLPTQQAGTCIVESSSGMVEATPLALVMGCAGMQNTCETFLGGTFEASEECASDSDQEVFCELAPGPIGAAHQAGYADGYFSDCPGTPGESSPYQWPTAWAADVNSKSVPFGNDTVIYESEGTVYYRLDRNWKRADTTFTRGVQRAIGQGPCAPEDVVSDPDLAINACRRDSDLRRTMIHRGSHMYFINWKNGTVGDDVSNIQDCSWLDLQIVGNVRPDWFMDDRGDDTDVQYLGNQHVYHNGVPRLVKQWRKKDFANQYFTMSMLGIPGDDGIHWPMILNVPGEGFGDDFLSIYTNHRSLTDEDDDLFLLDQALVASGGSCPKMESEGDVGPPTGGPEIPSNLEIEPQAWFSNVYTFSPIWDPPSQSDADQSMGEDDNTNGNEAITEAGDAVVGSCYDSSAKAVQMTLNFENVSPTDSGEIPWIALGYRPDEECAMNKNGADTDIILIASDPFSDIATASKGVLSPAARTLDPTAVTSIYTTLTPLENTEGYSDVSLTVTSGSEATVQTRAADLAADDASSVVLKFKQSMDEVPEVMYLMYAMGSTPELGYHATRMCFEVTQFPECAGEPSSKEENVIGVSTSGTSLKSAFVALFSMAFGALSVLCA